MIFEPTFEDIDLGSPNDRSSSQQKIMYLLTQFQLPDHTLHHLACDYAETLLQQEKATGAATDPASWQAIQTKRLWAEGKASGKQLQKDHLEAQTAASIMRYAHYVFQQMQDKASQTDHTQGIEKTKSAHIAARAAADASRYQVRYSDLSIAKNIVYALFQSAEAKQQQWILHRLKQRLQQYKQLRQQLVQLLNTKQVQRLKTNQNWRQQSEQLLFENG